MLSIRPNIVKKKSNWADILQKDIDGQSSGTVRKTVHVWSFSLSCLSKITQNSVSLYKYSEEQEVHGPWRST